MYVPNSKHDLSRLPYRQEWDRALLAYLQGLETRKPVVFCGDLNVAHTPLDLARPRQSVGAHGFTDEERGGFGAFIEAGFLDTFREFEPGGGHYTWWSPMLGAKARNVGWRIDYFLISGALRPHLQSAFIRCAVIGLRSLPRGNRTGPAEDFAGDSRRFDGMDLPCPPPTKSTSANLALNVHVGVTDEEQAQPQRAHRFLTLRPVRAALTTLEDRIENTVNYSAVCAAVRALACSAPAPAHRNARRDIAADNPRALCRASVDVELRKYILPDTDYVAVRLIAHVRPPDP